MSWFLLLNICLFLANPAPWRLARSSVSLAACTLFSSESPPPPTANHLNRENPRNGLGYNHVQSTRDALDRRGRCARVSKHTRKPLPRSSFPGALSSGEVETFGRLAESVCYTGGPRCAQLPTVGVQFNSETSVTMCTDLRRDDHSNSATGACGYGGI